MATNDFLVVAPGPAPNVASQATYAADPIVTTGNVSGVAKSAIINKALRQATVIAAMTAQLIADLTGQNSVDDGTIATLLTNFKGLFTTSRSTLRTSSGFFVVPLGITTIYLSGTACGGGGGAGGGGGGGLNTFGGGGGGGGAGQNVLRQAFTVTPGSTINFTMGSPGTGGTGIVVGNGNAGGSGGNLVITGAITLTLTGGGGGSGGVAGSSGFVPGGSGGSGSANGAWGSDGASSSGTASGGMGGSNYFGGGGAAARAVALGTGINGSVASGFGCGGGGGGGVYGTGSATSYAGGAGASGSPCVLLLEW